MLCGLKRQHQASPSTKRRRPLNCMAGNDPEPSYKPLSTTTKTLTTTKTAQRPRSLVQQSIQGRIVLPGNKVYSEEIEDKENLPKALSRLQLIGKNSQVHLPVDMHTEEMLGRAQFENMESHLSKSSMGQSIESLMTNTSSLPTMKNSSPSASLMIQQHACKKIRTDEGSMTTLSNTASMTTDALTRYRTSSKGHLHLSLSSKGNTLSVDVLEAKHVKSSWSSVANAFVKVQICPDNCKASTYETRTIIGTNQPKFAQLIAINLKHEDVAKRLVISVWHKDTKKSCTEFLGCLSFGLKHLVHKTRHGRKIDGWYHILPESIGHRKHILVDNEDENLCPVSGQPCNMSTPAKPVSVQPATTTPSQINEETLLEKDELIVKTLKIHFSSGYGFTVRNTRPITVGRVKEHSAAFSAGLHSGDVVTKINGKHLEKYSAEEAALMVRHSKDFVIVEIQCPHYRESMKDYFNNYMKPWKNPQNTDQQQTQTSNTSAKGDTEVVKLEQEGKVSSQEIWDLYNKQRRVSGDGEVNDTGFTEGHTTQLDSLHPNSCNDSDLTQSLLSKRQVHKVLKPECNDISLWDPSISLITQNSQYSRFTCSYRSESYMEALSPDYNTKGLTFSLATEPEESHCVSRKVKGIPDSRHNNTLVTESSFANETDYQTDVDVTIGTEEGISHWTDDTMTTEASDPHSYGAENRGFMSDDEMLNNSCLLESDFYSDQEDFDATPLKRKDSAMLVEEQIYREKYHSDASLDTTESIDEFWLICSPKSQERFVENLVKEECRFNINMERGIKKYLWPSRRVLSGDDFRVIFQNAEKLLAISNFVQHQMREELDRSEVTHFKSVLDLYKNKSAMLLQAYSTYASGLSRALQRLDENKLHSLDFQQFLHEAWEQERHLSIDDFLMLPILHLTNVHQVFSEMLDKCQHDPETVKMLQGLREVLDQAPVNTETACTPLPPKVSHL